MLISGLHQTLQTDHVRAPGQPDDPLAAIGEVLNQLHRTAAHGEHELACIPRTVDHRVGRQGVLVDWAVDVLEVVFLQARKQGRGAQRAAAAIGVARPCFL